MFIYIYIYIYIYIIALYIANRPAFLSNIKLEQLQITVLKASFDFSKMNNIC